MSSLAVCSLATASAAADDLTRSIKVSPDGHFLVQPDGQPFFWLGDTAWELFRRLDREEADAYLRDRAEKGFTVVQVNAIGLLGGLSSPNAYGELPLIKGDPTRPNPSYFQHVDWIVNRAAHHGLRIAMLPVWGAFHVGGYGAPSTKVFDAKNAEVYGRWLASRYRDQGIIWVLGGDTNPLYPREIGLYSKSAPDGTIVDYRPVYDALAKGLAEGSASDPFITYHPTAVSYYGTPQPRTSLYIGNRDWLDMNMLQSGQGADPAKRMTNAHFERVGGNFSWNARMNYSYVNEEYESVPVRPIVDGEGRFEGHPAEEAQEGIWTDIDARNAAYHAVFAGAAGHTYGNFSIWDLYDSAVEVAAPFSFLDRNRPGWRAALNAPGAHQMKFVKALLLSRPYFTRIPDQSLIVGDAGEGERHIAATRSRDGSYALVYVPDGRPVTIDMAKLAGSAANGWWFDPRTGNTRHIAGDLPTNQSRRFTPPTNGPGQDWVLVLDDAAKNFAAPRERHHESVVSSR